MPCPDLVSVVMAVHNGEPHLSESITSVLDQSHADFEFVVVNDGSTDGTVEIIRSYSDNRIRLFNRPHSGLPASLNFGIRVSSGLYIARQDADDISDRDRLKEQLSVFASDPTLDFCASDFQIIDESGRFIANRAVPRTNDQLQRELRRQNPICHGSVMLKKSAFDKYGNYDERLQFAQDYELWIRMLERGARYTSSPEHLYQYRISSNSTARAWVKQKNASNFRKFAKASISRVPEPKIESVELSSKRNDAIYDYTVGSFKLADGRRSEAIRFLIKSLIAYPHNYHAWAKLFVALIPSPASSWLIRFGRTLLNNSFWRSNP